MIDKLNKQLKEIDTMIEEMDILCASLESRKEEIDNKINNLLETKSKIHKLYSELKELKDNYKGIDNAK